MERQHRDCGAEANMFCPCGDIGEHQVRAGEHAEGAEMVLPYPRRMEANLIGVDCLIKDVRNELVGASMVVFVVVVAKCEITKIHFLPYLRS